MGILRRSLPAGDIHRAEIGRWLAIAGAGALVAASWAVYPPVTDHYVPTTTGTVNRNSLVPDIDISSARIAQMAALSRGTVRLVN